MAKQINTSVGGVKKASKVFTCIGGVVKTVKKGLAGVGGVVKTFFESDLVLWNGSLQNGAYYTYISSPTTLRYDFTAGALNGKSLVFKFPSTVSACIVVSGGTAYYAHSDGTVSTTKKLTSWTGGKEYVFPISLFKVNNNYIKIGPMKDAAGTGIISSAQMTNMSYIAIR